jgi:DNA-binding transcriptional regulator YhcF (GntR family)
MDDRDFGPLNGTPGGSLDVERDSDVPISTQIYWQLAYQIDSGRLLPGSRLPPVRELGAALRVNPNTIRAVYRRLSDAGYVTSRHGAGTHVAERPPQRRGAEALAGIVAEMLRRAAQAGFSADELAAATFAAATERKRPGPLVRVLFAECTTADAGYDAERLVDEFPGMIEAEGALLDDLPDRLDRFHYDIVATTTFHADEAQALVAAAFRWSRCSSAPHTSSSSTRSPDSQRLPGRARLRIGPGVGEHPRDADDLRQPRGRDRLGPDREQPATWSSSTAPPT